MPRKAPQCQADDPAHDWTHEELLRVMAADHLSAWDPYIRYGMYETINDEALPPPPGSTPLYRVLTALLMPMTGLMAEQATVIFLSK